MSKLKINIEELSKDMDKIFDLLNEFDNGSLKVKDVKNFSKEANKLKNQFEQKYSKNLDSKK